MMERGQLIAGRYELVKRLGRGGMGEVWDAKDRSLHRSVAVKLLDLDGVAHRELSQRFEREAVAAAQINHPNVVALYDRGVHEDVLFLVMEKVAGATLSDHIHTEGPMPLARALEITDGICAALAAAHQASVIHYDIKPHNVMLTPDGQVKVVDFGIAGFIQATFTVARSSQLSPAGTPEYGAPEQFVTERGDERSDLYSLGGVLFAMLAGRPPFTGHNGLAVMRRKFDEAAPRLDSLRPGLPPAVTEFVADLLHRDPQRRPQTARQVHERLQQLLADGVSQHAETSHPMPTAVQPPPTDRMGAPRQQPPQPAAPFNISWSGEDPLPTYADASGYRNFVRLMTVLLIVTPVGAVIAVANGVFDESPEGGLVGLFAVSTSFGVLSLLALLALPLSQNVYRTPKGWSLSVEPQCIVTTSAFGRRTYQRSRVRDFVIEEIQVNANSLYTFTGLHLNLAEDVQHRPATGQFANSMASALFGARPGQHSPAGWPPRYRVSSSSLTDGMVPICVLGPMTDQQRAELSEALDRYSERR
ncbi:serine/threonine-protein kinase [Streptomyces sp. NPDC048506]|uniref:serine/threonine-protein kinase n=1 Tax=Streptomyces sp. NPDC048506 TaxID=3155028 RepID=UPI003428148C